MSRGAAPPPQPTSPPVTSPPVSTCTSTPSASSAPTLRPTPPPIKYDKDVLLKVAENLSETDSAIQVRLRDYGGQDVFAGLLAFLLTYFSVNLITFNMEDLLNAATKEKCLEEVGQWISKIYTSTRDPNTHQVAPMLLVGTRGDTVASPAEHELINQAIYDRFSKHPAWPFIVPNSNGQGRGGRTTFFFYPINNKLGRNDINTTHLLNSLQQVIQASQYVHEPVRLTWLKFLDAIVDHPKAVLTKAEILAIGR